MAIEISVKKALEELQTRYVRMSKLAVRLVKIMKQTGPLPPQVTQAYGEAMRNYLQFGRHVFDALTKKGLEVEQIVYREGKPAPMPGDPSKFKTLRIAAPLIPAPVIPGAIQPITGIGAIPALLYGGALVAGKLAVRVVSSKLFATLAKWVVGGYVLSAVLDRIMIIVHGHPLENKPIEQAEAFNKIVKNLTDLGMPPDQAVKEAAERIAPPEPHPPSWGSLALGAFAIAATGYAAVKIFGGGKS